MRWEGMEGNERKGLAGGFDAAVLESVMSQCLFMERRESLWNRSMEADTGG